MADRNIWTLRDNEGLVGDIPPGDNSASVASSSEEPSTTLSLQAHLVIHLDNFSAAMHNWVNTPLRDKPRCFLLLNPPNCLEVELEIPTPRHIPQYTRPAHNTRGRLQCSKDFMTYMAPRGSIATAIANMVVQYKLQCIGRIGMGSLEAEVERAVARAQWSYKWEPSQLS